MSWSRGQSEGTRAKALAKLRAAGAQGATAVDFAAFFARRRVKDGFPARHVAGAAGALARFCAEGYALRLTARGRHAIYCITGAGLDWLGGYEARAREAAATGRRPRTEPLEVPPELDAPPAGLFDSG